LLGLYVKDSAEIAAGHKTLLAAANPRLIPGPQALILKEGPDYFLAGTLVLGEPQAVDLATFDTQQSAHLIARKQRLQWWPEATTLYLYPFTYSAGPRQPVNLAPGLVCQVQLPDLGLHEIAALDGYYIYEVE